MEDLKIGRRSRAWRFAGIDSLFASDGRAELAMATSEEMTNHQGTVHGGFIAMLADSAMGQAMATRTPAGTRQLSFDLKLSFINFARPGERLKAKAAVVHAGRRTGVAECQVEGEDGRLVATASGTFSVYLPD
jgi:uncharacterized protein (TIGR00369 family)